MVDSSVWIDYFNGKECPEVIYLDAILGVKPVVIGDNILTISVPIERRDA